MFSLFRKHLLFLPNCRSFSSSQVRKLFIRSQAREFSSSSYSPCVNVWWDADECQMPSGFTFSMVASSIKAAIRANGIMGHISILAYGNHDSSMLEPFSSTGIFPIKVDNDKSAHKCILMDLLDKAELSPPPRHFFLILSSGDFSGILHQLRMRNYNILLACPGRVHVSLYHAATIIWQWSSLLKGEDLIGKHFNYPPDDLFNSWYGNSNVPLENPFSHPAKIYKPSSNIKLGEASKSISRQVMKILNSHPNGISIGDLRAELTKCNLPRFYGYKFFSNFLVSIPHVQLQYLGEGNFWVHLVPSIKNKIATQKLHNEGKNMDRSVDGILKISSSYVSNEGDDSKSLQFIPSQGKPIGDYVDGKSSLPSFNESNVRQPPDMLRKTSLGCGKVVDVLTGQLPMYNNYISNKSDNDIARCEDVCLEIMGEKTPSQNTSTSTFFNWISSWWTLWKSNAKPDDLTAHEDVICSRKPELFEDSKLCEVDWGASHFEEPNSSKLQLDDIRVWVWWDFNSCGVPSNISFLNVAPSIMGVLRANQIKGPIHIDAYGDVSQLSKIQQEALLLSDIDLHHIGRKNNSHKWLMDWVSQKPPPAHLFLISGEKDFYFTRTVRGLSYYNILFACPRSRGHFPVHRGATIVWQWSSMLKGKYLTGKYFMYPLDWYIKGRVPLEYPPEWYRNSKIPLENRFSTADEPTSSQNADEPSSYIKLVGVPESLSRQVREILSSYPNGISIGDLRLQCRLRQSKWAKGFYGHEVFSNILVSIPHVQLLYIGEGNFCVRLIPSTTFAVKNKQRDVKNEQVFSIGSFWEDVESYVFTCRAARLLSRSRSREDLAHKLQKHGPPFLRCLTENDILQLVELLIAEKKWLEESPSQAFPFRLTQAV